MWSQKMEIWISTCLWILPADEDHMTWLKAPGLQINFEVTFSHKMCNVYKKDQNDNKKQQTDYII